MFKLQVVLVPASTNRSFNFGLPPVSSESSQFILPQQQGPQVAQPSPQPLHHAQLVNHVPNSNAAVGFDPNMSTNTAYISSFMTSHITRTKPKKFLLFTKPSNTLYQLSQEILDKCNKIYPNLSSELDIETLQDIDECDLDPDFVVKDVFNVFNTVRVILRNDVDLDSELAKQDSLYSSKRRKLNSGAASTTVVGPVAGVTLDNPVTVVKRRSHALKNSALRISTPLAHQIYPPPSQRNSKQVNSDYEDDDYGEDEIGDKSVLPPPTVPQSPPIRISSSMGQKRLRINGGDDSVSKSETVDPSKAKQQRLPSGTPMKPMNVIETPNKVGSLPLPQQAQNLLRINSTPVVTNKRITSGMLRIPEPRISEMERTMHEGPSSPAAGLLPPKSAKIPMKKPYIPDVQDSSSSEEDLEEEQPVATKPRVAHSSMPLTSQKRAPSSIADDNGSPTKKSPLVVSNNINVRVAELPPQRKTSLEAKVERLAKNASELIADNLSNNTTRKDGFSESETDDGENDNEANNTVQIHQPTEKGDGSFQKSDLLDIINGARFDVPPGFKKSSFGFQETELNRRSRKPYLTVLNKDIDNSEPDPRNILPERIPRHAAQKAAQFISTGTSRNPLESSSSATSENTGSNSDSDLETENSDESIDELNLKRLNVHPLQPVVVPIEESSNTNNVEAASSNAASSDAFSSAAESGTSDSQKVPSEEGGSKSTAVNLMPPSQADEMQRSVETSTKLVNLTSVGPAIETNNPLGSQEISEKIEKQLSPSPVRNRMDYVSPEFIIDSDDDQARSNSENIQDGKENKIPGNLEPAVSSDGSRNKKLSPSHLKRRKEAEKRRLEREAAKKAKQEEMERRRAEKKAAKKAKQEEVERKRAEREAAKKAKQEELSRKKAEVEAKKASQEQKKINKEGKPSKKQPNATENDKDNVSEALVEHSTKMSDDRASDSSKLTSPKSSKLDELRHKFAIGKASLTGPPKKAVNKPAQVQFSSSAKSGENSSSDSDSDSSSSSGSTSPSDSDNSSSEEEASMTRKSRRGIVDTPKGIVGSITKRNVDSESFDLQNAPQSTQKPTVTPVKVPVTKMMEYASPASTVKQNPSTSISPPAESVKSDRQKLARSSLSSLSDLVSRGVPEVKEKTASKSLSQQQAESSSDDEEEISSDSDDSSDSNSDSDSDSSNDGAGSNFINAKSASKALGKKKYDSGFASLIKDSKRK